MKVQTRRQRCLTGSWIRTIEGELHLVQFQPDIEVSQSQARVA